MAGAKVYYAKEYQPIQAGSIDGVDYVPHDHGVQRALLASSFYDPAADPKAVGDPYCTIFVGQLSRDTSEETLHKAMSQYGRIKSLRLVRHIVTGASRGYAFVEFENERDYLHAYEKAHHITIDGKQIIVDYNRQQLMPGWIPRRLGGGLGGRKESGQLRFGGRERPFRAPFMNAIRKEELEKHGISLPSPDRLVSRYQVPPPPKRPRKQDNRDEEEGASRSHSRRHEGDGKRVDSSGFGHHRRRRDDGSKKEEEGARYDRQEDRDRRRSRREEEQHQSGKKHGDSGSSRHRSSQDRYGDDEDRTKRRRHEQ